MQETNKQQTLSQARGMNFHDGVEGDMQFEDMIADISAEVHE